MALTNTPVEAGRRGDDGAAESLLPLLHAAWLRWPVVRRSVYRVLGVANTEELIRRVVDTEECRVRDSELARLQEALERVVADTREAREQLESLAERGVWVTSFTSKEYPCELLRYPAHGDYLYPPLMLYWLGARVDPNERPIVAVVGTRRCSAGGRRLARAIGGLLARRGLMLVTGLAECIDTEAALGALEEGGIVVGVRPWLLPLSLPAESRRLLRSLRGGLVVASENPWKPARGSIKRLYFLRNRVIAGMAKLVVVVEALPAGGSMHQVELALKRGKPVAVYEPPHGTPYWQAYRHYREKGAIGFNSLAQLDEIIRNTVESSP